MLKYLPPALWLAPVSFTGEVPTNLSYSFDAKLIKKTHTHTKRKVLQRKDCKERAENYLSHLLAKLGPQVDKLLFQKIEIVGEK